MLVHMHFAINMLRLQAEYPRHRCLVVFILPMSRHLFFRLLILIDRVWCFNFADGESEGWQPCVRGIHLFSFKGNHLWSLSCIIEPVMEREVIRSDGSSGQLLGGNGGLVTVMRMRDVLRFSYLYTVYA
jgi:hypothetical protein